MRIDRRTSEHLVDPVDQPIRDGMLEVLGFVVHFGPAHAHHLHQEQLDQAVPAQHQRRELLAGRRQPDAGVGLVRTSPDSASALTIVVAVPGTTPSATASWPIGTSSLRRGRRNLGLKDGFQVVFDGARMAAAI